MTTHTNGATAPIPSTSTHTAPVVDTSDHTAEHIKAFLLSLRLPVGFSSDAEYQGGVDAIHHIADSVPKENPIGQPAAQLSALEIADVLAFLHHSEPRNPQDWWNDGADNVRGFLAVLWCLEENVRRLGDDETPEGDGDASGCPALPAALDAHLSRQQDLAARLAELLKVLGDDADPATGRKGALGIAQELAEGISDALDTVVIERVAQEAAIES